MRLTFPDASYMLNFCYTKHGPGPIAPASPGRWLEMQPPETLPLLLLFSHSVVSDSLWLHGLQHAWLPSFTISRSLIKFMSIVLVMPSNHLILRPRLLLPAVFPNIRVFSNEKKIFRWFGVNKSLRGTLLEIQWLRLRASTTGGREFHPWSVDLRFCMPHSAAYSPPPRQKRSLRSNCCHMLFILLLTKTLEGDVFNPCSQMRKLKLSGDGNLPMSRRGSMKGNDPLPREKIFCGANSDIVSNVCCLITFPNMWTLPLQAKTKSLHLLSHILSGHSP